MRILIIEDDREAASYLVKAFREAGHVADHADNGLDGYAMAESGDYDVLVVDRMLPKLDGLSLIRSLREQKVETPVLILSALGQVDDRVKGLRAGGDDYLPKPYAFSELLARAEVLARRRSAGGPRASRPPIASAISNSTGSRTASCAPAMRSCCSRGNSACSNTS
jgi:two-component system OmpR family response regulator